MQQFFIFEVYIIDREQGRQVNKIGNKIKKIIVIILIIEFVVIMMFLIKLIMMFLIKLNQGIKVVLFNFLFSNDCNLKNNLLLLVDLILLFVKEKGRVYSKLLDN